MVAKNKSHLPSAVAGRVDETPRGSSLRVTVIKLTPQAKRTRDVGDVKLEVHPVARAV